MWGCDVSGPKFSLPYATPEPCPISQSDLEDLVRNLELPKNNASLTP